MPFKFAHIGDIHIGSYQGKIEAGGLNSRFVDFIKTFNESIDKMIENKVDFCLIAGDIFRSKTPTPEEINEFGKGIKRLVDNGIPTIVVLGNHDLFLADNRTHSIGILETLLSYDQHGFIISKKPEIIKVKNRKGEELQIQTMPYPIRSLLKLENNLKVVDYVNEKTREVYDSRDVNLPIMYCGHYSLRGASVGGEQKLIDRFAEPVIDEAMFKGKEYLYVAMGHIHTYQEVANNPPVVYCGSNNRVDFNEASEDKGFVLVKLGKKTEYEFVKVDARRFVDLKYELKDNEDPGKHVLDDLNSKIDIIKDAIVRISVVVSQANEKKYDTKLVSDFLEQHAYWVHGNCLPIILKENLERDTNGFAESMDALQALRHYAEVNKVGNKDDFLKLGEQIIKEITEQERSQ
jgi:exonuclease SbcD